VTPLRITVTGAKTRFGSCSGKNSISFSFYLMRYPEEAVDYVVVHELCHIIHHNHSAAFYKEVEKILPDYKRREKILRTYTGKAPGQEN
ncbi:MAG: M48 family metallopeptidase, partial [Clostridia bacterium]|nr:M48 family metallopeptidase [Clostridia bacterium]